MSEQAQPAQPEGCAGSELVKKVFLTSSQTRTAGLGSRLKRLHRPTRIICAHTAHKFHTCRAFCVLSDAAASRKSASGTFLAQAEAAMPRGGTTWGESPAGANSTRFFDSLTLPRKGNLRGSGCLTGQLSINFMISSRSYSPSSMWTTSVFSGGSVLAHSS